MSGPMRIRAAVGRDGIVEVRVLMSHEMESGQRVEAGAVVPAWFISQVTATHNGRTVMTAQWGPSVSKNPYFAFKFRGGKAGDKIALSWIDNRNETRSDETTIA
ncbi:MAG: thiosulfate oxidation carrier complex protein SoxZ [Magnetospirillum sp.]|jgi:sulfur-oxidizing protein SoxZ|nr:thiosulfate oxidation carrier complex protein SoxZ [Magnetospirillum sp.]